MVESAAKRMRYFVLILFFLALALLLFLGAWQTSRGLEKKALENALANRSSQYTEIYGKPEMWETFDQQLVTLVGQWLPDKTFLMDNRVSQGKVGYEIYSPYELSEDGTIVLVNRGWLSASESTKNGNSMNRSQRKSTFVKGHLYLPHAGFTLGKAITDRNSWPKVIQYFDQPQLSEALGMKISPAVLVLNEDDKMSFRRIWKPLVMNSNRHFGYALQWWGLALTLLIFGIIWRKKSFF